jgi:hypothetical protein
MATVSAIYGTGIYGSSEYGVINVTASIAGVSGTGTIANVVAGGFEVDITERISTGVSATGASNTVQPNITEKIDGVVGTGAVNDNWTIRSVYTASIAGVSATTAVNEALNFVVTIGPIASVSATASLGTLREITTSEALESVSATISLGTLTVTGVIFNFVANDYDRKRVVYVPRQDTVAERRVAA